MADTRDDGDGGKSRRRRAAEARALITSGNAVCATAPAATLRLRMSNTRACQVALICLLTLLRVLSQLGYDGIILDLLSAAAAMTIASLLWYRRSQQPATAALPKSAWLEDVSLDCLDDLCVHAILQHLPSVVDMVNSGTTCSRLHQLTASLGLPSPTFTP